MTKLIVYMLPGLILAIILNILCATVVSDSTQNTIWFDKLQSILTIACIVVPCIIYYIKMPPGTNTKP